MVLPLPGSSDGGSSVTPQGAIVLYLTLRRYGIPLRAIDPGERVTLPAVRACSCGRRKPKWAPKQKRWICECGKHWPVQVFISCVSGQRRPNPPGEKQLDFLAEMGMALDVLDYRQRRIALLWHDHQVLPHSSGRWRQTEVGQAVRERAGVVANQYDAAMDALGIELQRRGIVV